MKISYSQLYRAIAKIAEHLEDHLAPEEFNFLDGGLTLQIEAGVIARIDGDLWQRLQQDFEQVGGCVYVPDFAAA